MSAKKKKLYGAIVAVGLVALLVDQVFLAEPAPAVAARAMPRAGVAAGAAGGEPDASVLAAGVAAAPFPRRLPDPGPIASLRDAFALTPRSRQAMLGSSGETGMVDPRTGRPVGRPSAASDFESSHKLSAVMSGTDTEVAIVDEEWVSVGEVIGGCKLTRITGQTAHFQCADGPAVLIIATRNDRLSER